MYWPIFCVFFRYFIETVVSTPVWANTSSLDTRAEVYRKKLPLRSNYNFCGTLSIWGMRIVTSSRSITSLSSGVYKSCYLSACGTLTLLTSPSSIWRGSYNIYKDKDNVQAHPFRESFRCCHRQYHTLECSKYHFRMFQNIYLWILI